MRLSRVFIIGGLLALTACSGDVGKVLGLTKEAPDEFSVVTREPLVLPPNFGLRPPTKDQKRVEADKARKLAEAALFGTEKAHERRLALRKTQEQFQGGELAMLMESDSVGANPEIRDLVDLETTDLAQANDTVLNEIMFWKDIEDGVIIDAAAETERVNENTSLGRPITEGDTPMIIRDGEGGGLF